MTAKLASMKNAEVHPFLEYVDVAATTLLMGQVKTGLHSSVRVAPVVEAISSWGCAEGAASVHAVRSCENRLGIA